MINKLRKMFKKPIEPIVEEKPVTSIFGEDVFARMTGDKRYDQTLERIAEVNLKPPPQPVAVMDGKIQTVAMDDSQSLKSAFQLSSPNAPLALLNWYAAQGFIGFQFCAIIAQHWLVDKACTIPGQDAIRKGYDVTVNDGTELEPEVLDAIKQADVKYKLNFNMEQHVRFCRIFGIRIALFEVESDDPDYYYNPFNIDGIKPGSYKGISQIDPYWVTPMLDQEATANPMSKYFYEPTWWMINGKLIHRTHLIVSRHSEVPDVLKPAYFYGGVSLTQQIYERVYCAERTANEAPLLAMTKRLTGLKIDIEQALANQGSFEQKLQQFAFMRDNYGIKTVGLEEDILQFETSLGDLDNVIMTQYQLVAAVARMPSSKLLEISPKGFNATGEFEESSYHEALESIQSQYCTPLLQRHHDLLIRSEIAPNFGIAPFDTTIVWKSLDSMTAKEKADMNLVKAQTAAQLASIGAIGDEDERNRIINDPDSGYSGIDEELPQPDINEENPTSMIPNEPESEKL